MFLLTIEPSDVVVKVAPDTLAKADGVPNVAMTAGKAKAAMVCLHNRFSFCDVPDIIALFSLGCVNLQIFC